MHRAFALFVAFIITATAFGGGLYARHATERAQASVRSGQSLEASLLGIASVPRIDTFFELLRNRITQFFFGNDSRRLGYVALPVRVVPPKVLILSDFSDVFSGITFPYPKGYVVDERFSLASTSQVRFRDVEGIAEWWVRLMPNIEQFSWARGASRYGTDREGMIRDVAGAIVEPAGRTAGGNDFFDLRAIDRGTQFLEYAVPIFERDAVVLIGTAWDERLATIPRYTKAIESAREASHAAVLGLRISTSSLVLRAPFVPAKERERRREEMTQQNTARVAKIVAAWGAVQRTITQSLTLGAREWHLTDIQIITPEHALVAFEDGHVRFGAVLSSATSSTTFVIREYVPDGLLTEKEWRTLVGRYALAPITEPIGTYTQSIVRGTDTFQFKEWTLVPENVFIRR
jgi:hypothetical protein